MTSTLGPNSNNNTNNTESAASRRLLAIETTPQVENDIVMAFAIGDKLVDSNGNAVPYWQEIPLDVPATCDSQVNITDSLSGIIGVLPGASTKTTCAWSVVGPPGVLRYELFVNSLPTEMFSEPSLAFVVYDGDFFLCI